HSMADLRRSSDGQLFGFRENPAGNAFSASWPGLSRPSTSLPKRRKASMARTSPAMAPENVVRQALRPIDHDAQRHPARTLWRLAFEALATVAPGSRGIAEAREIGHVDETVRREPNLFGGARELLNDA